MADLMSGPNCPVTKAFLFCGWRALAVDWLFGEEHDLSKPSCQEAIAEQLKDACFLVVAMDCSTKKQGARDSGARSIRKGYRGCPCKISGELPRKILRVRSSLTRCKPWGGGTIRENPTNSLHRHLPREKRMQESGTFWETQYDSCCWGGARCKKQILKHNIEEVNHWPAARYHQYKLNGLRTRRYAKDVSVQKLGTAWQSLVVGHTVDLDIENCNFTLRVK